MATMRAWQVSSIADPPMLAPAQLPVPTPREGEGLVRVAYAALNFSDLLMVRGTYQVKPPLPFTPGQEISGTVIEAGPRGGAAVGTRIAAKVLWGGFAERAVVRTDMAIPLPPNISLAEGATIPVAWPTAWIALFNRGRLVSGEQVLILAAAGGVGIAAVQLAKAAGARVIAATRGTDKLALCRSLGADIVIDYSASTWVEDVLKATDGRGADVVFDPVGGGIGDSSVKCLAWGGRLLVVGYASGQIPAIRTNRLMLRNAGVLGV
jgi:NADPH:quinone reductase